jgi:hypothetical protein
VPSSDFSSLHLFCVLWQFLYNINIALLLISLIAASRFCKALLSFNLFAFDDDILVQATAEMAESAAITFMDRLAARLGVPRSTLFPAYPAVRGLLSQGA